MISLFCLFCFDIDVQVFQYYDCVVGDDGIGWEDCGCIYLVQDWFVVWWDNVVNNYQNIVVVFVVQCIVQFWNQCQMVCSE